VLDETGRCEAAALAAVLGGVGLVSIVSSPLRRAVETASAIADQAGLEVSTSPGLIDRDYGPWAGQLESEVMARFGTVSLAPGVEDAEVMLQRARAVLEEQRLVLARGSVVLVSHDVVNRALLTHLDPHLPSTSDLGQHTACWNVLRPVEGGWAVESVNQQAPVL
jgi:broad specificity phosphatase PhoE